MDPLEDAVRRVLREGFEVEVTETDRFLLAERWCDGTQVIIGFSNNARLVRHFVHRSVQAFMGQDTNAHHVRKLMGLVLREDGTGLLKHPPLEFNARKPCGH